MKIRASEAMRRACQTLSAHYGKTAPDLTLPQLAILRDLNGTSQDLSLSQRNICEHIGMDSSTLQTTIYRLVRKGYVGTARRPECRRTSMVWLTASGLRALHRAEKDLIAAEAAFMAKVPAADREPFLRGLRAIAEARP